MDDSIHLSALEASQAGACGRCASALERRGYAIVRVDNKSGSVLRELSRAGLEFFETTPREAKMRWRFTFADAGGLGLIGWNAPHAAKEVVRCRRGAASKVPSCPVSLRDSLRSAFDVVERVAAAVVATVASVEASSFASPFDLMFYPNCNEEPNSTPHVDSPGFVTVIPVSATPGLVVLDQHLERWVHVETQLAPFFDCVVLVADSLPLVCGRHLTAATHAVAKADRPRLSLVYELRPGMDQARELWRQHSRDLHVPSGEARRDSPRVPVM